MTSAAEWFEVAFGELYPLLYAHRSEEAAAQEVGFLMREAGLKPGGDLLDLACGEGRHQRAFDAAGFRTTGLDYSRPLLEQHRQRATLPILRGDMRRLPLADESFDSVTQLFTAFGYFETEAEDDLVVSEVQRVLRPGGRYVLDFLRVEHVRANLVPRSEKSMGDWHIQEERRLEPDHVVKAVVLSEPKTGRRIEYEERVRLYDRSRLEQKFRRFGMEPLACFGDFQGSPPESGTRCLLVAERRS